MTAQSANRIAVLYDDQCGLCASQMRLLRRLDWWGALTFVAIFSPETKALAPKLSREELLEAIHCVTPAGQVHRGARCLRHLCMRLPLAIPFALILWIPGALWLAEKAYRQISRHRHWLSRPFGAPPVCPISSGEKEE